MSCLLLTTNEQAQSSGSRASQRVAAGPAGVVHAGDGLIAESEGVLVADPGSPSTLLACTMASTAKFPGTVIVVSVRAPGASKWKETFRSQATVVAGDPACAFGPAHRAYLAYIAASPPPAKIGLHIETYHSTDAGLTWTRGPDVPYMDRISLAVDHSAGPFQGRVYLLGGASIRDMDGSQRDTLAMYRSLDHGLSFVGPAQRMIGGRRRIALPGPAVVGPDGRVSILFGELKAYWREEHGNERGPLEVSQRLYAPATLNLASSDDGGQTFAESSKVSDWFLPNEDKVSIVSAVPALAVDNSDGPFRGRLYVLWPDVRRWNTSQLRLAHSADRGRTWSDAVTVTTLSHSETTFKRDHQMPMLAVNAQGVLGIAWLDRRNADDNRGWTTRFTASLDGGHAFSDDIEILELSARFSKDRPIVSYPTILMPGTPAAPAPATITLSLPPFTYFPGDYGVMTATPDGAFYPYGISNVADGRHRLWTTAVRVEGKPSRFGALELAGMADVTAEIQPEIITTAYVPGAAEATVDIQLKNRSRRTVQGPFYLLVSGTWSEFGRPRPANPDAVPFENGAVWRFLDGPGAAPLGPDDASPLRTLRFQLTDVKPATDGERFRWTVVQFQARVIAGSPRVPRESPEPHVKPDAKVRP